MSKSVKSIAYISGPMTGIHNNNKEAFERAELVLSALGYIVKNPIVIEDNSANQPYEVKLKLALKMMLESDIVVLLSGWEESKGVKIEVNLANAIDMRVVTLKELV